MEKVSVIPKSPGWVTFLDFLTHLSAFCYEAGSLRESHAIIF